MKKKWVAVALWGLAACSTAAQPAKQPAPDDTVATVGTTAITLSQVDERALRRPVGAFGNARLGQALYLARLAALDDLVGNELMDQEATKRGVERAQLVETEIASLVTTPTDADINTWYQANPARVQGATLDQVRVPIRNMLIEERMDVAREKFLVTLKARTPVSISLEPPRQKVADAGHASKGPDTAPIVMVEFSDYQCPFCQRANPTVEQVLKTYGDKIRFVYRHYPLANHPDARPAAEAAACAQEQDKFWPYHDQLFANVSRLSAQDLKDHASAAGLDSVQFASCVDSRRFKSRVDADVAEAEEAGVTGTPAFFINGRPLEGAQPFEAFQRIIDEELERK
ncbi:MAG: thioredoxin domain-containing protein [Luteitalea sp.]|nr:thioredoxin domain-containing protein [Luteitalea sp.]